MTDALHPLWIDKPDAIGVLADRCRTAGAFAMDTEADSLHSYFHKVCLVQISVAGQHAVIDPLAIEDEALSPLWDVCSDPDITVLMHGADYDIRVLDRDYEADIHGLQDTQIMAMLLGEKKTGLASLLESFFEIGLDKRHQRADWGMRPLTESMVAYAAADTAHLEALTSMLRRRLEDLGRWEWAKEDFRRLEGVRHQPVERDPRAFERVKGVNALRGLARDRAFSLVEWREAQARRRDLPPFKILGNQPLLHMAQTIPEGPNAMGMVPGIGPRFVQRYGRAVAELLTVPQEAPEWQRPLRRPPGDPGTKKRIARLTEARDANGKALEIDGAILCPRATLEAVAEVGTGADTQALQAAGMGGWRLELLGEAFVEVLKADI
ncbi:MAG: HRDC domain-containing protein [Acidobacteria bacterium]|nr:HRDC domain-containing protein [Acidobacteriota bacterium]